jgi:glucose/arabinose dehydrogenase
MESDMTIAGATSGIRQRARVFAKRFQSAIRNPQSAIALLLLALTTFLPPGCARPPAIIPAELRKPIDRALVEYPADTQLERYVANLTAPTAIAFDEEKNLLLVAESGASGAEPRILAFNYVDGSSKAVYPQGKVFGPFRSISFRMYGPIGGMAVRDGIIYVSHRDKNDFGVISAVGYDGKGKTVVAGLPAQGDYGVTDLAFSRDGRLYFGVGSATNSGVVGLDNWDWVQQHPKVADEPFVPISAPEQTIQLRGARFFTIDPRAGLFAATERAVTAPFQYFGEFQRSRIDAAADGKPNSAIYSIDPSGGIASELKVEAYGIRLPSGLAFISDADRDGLFVSNQGMEPRGTRPVWNDPDVVLQIFVGPTNFGFPDYSADLFPVSNARFQPPNPEVIRSTGYTDVTPLVDQFRPPGTTDQDSLVRAKFDSLSGASKMAFVPDDSPLTAFRKQLVVAQAGARLPFAIERSGVPLKKLPGHKVVRFDAEGAQKVAYDMIRNTAGEPRSNTKGNRLELLERPIDVKFGPDGFMYVLDFGKADYRDGRPNVTPRTGQIYRLLPANMPSTGPTLKNVDAPGMP